MPIPRLGEVGALLGLPRGRFRGSAVGLARPFFLAVVFLATCSGSLKIVRLRVGA
jgi:hypothetical protein